MATDSFVRQLMDERNQKVQVIENLASVAHEEGRDLHDSDLQTIDNYRSRIAVIDTQIEKVAGDLELADSVRTRVRYLDPEMGRDFSYRSAGEYLVDAFTMNRDPVAHKRWTQFHKRAAEHMGYDKDNTVPVAGGYNGLVISPVVGAILNPRPEGRPLFAALGVRPIESGSFMRPRIVDPNFDTGVGPQGQEKSELPSKAWDILNEPVNAIQVGGYINISQLLLSMIPASFDMIVAQMNRRLEAYTERAAVTEMAKTAATIPLAADADSGAINAALGQASATVYANTGDLPTWLAMGPKAWGRLIGTSDLAGRPMIPPVGPVNAWGGGGGTDTFFTSFAGMRVVVSYAISDADMYVGNAYGLEVYEKRLPILEAIEPSVLGRQLAVASLLAFYRPPTKEAGPSNTPPAEYNGVVKIDWA